MLNWKFKTQGHRPIGLDIGNNSIKMIQLAVNSGHIKVLAADKVRIDPAVNGDASQRRSFVVSAIKQMLAEGKFCGQDVISCLPNDSLKITSLRLAEGEEQQVEQELRKEVSQRFGLDPDKDAISYVHAGSVKHGDEVKNEFILFAAESEAIKSHIAMLEEAQLKPVAIDTIPCALFRSFERSLRRQEDAEQTVVFVDVGSKFTTVVFGRGREISFVKQIPIGGEKFNQELASKLGVSVNEAEILRDMLRMERSGSEPLQNAKSDSFSNSEAHYKMEASAGFDSSSTGLAVGQATAEQTTIDPSTRQAMVDAISTVAEELAREISLCFRYYTVTFRGKRVERAVFAGGEAYESILLNVLKRQLTVEIEIAQPLKGFDMKDVNFGTDRRGLLCEWAVAVGLGLKGLDTTGGRGGNHERN